MKFYVYKRGERRSNPTGSICLIEDRWNDYGFYTAFDIEYKPPARFVAERLGWIKIASIGMKPGDKTIDLLPEYFESLDESFITLGTSRKYYKAVANLGDDLREEIHRALRDISYDLALFEQFEYEDVVHTSLMRESNKFDIKNQYHRIALGGAELTEYRFIYKPASNSLAQKNVELSFDIEPVSLPPSNVHVLVGRNGTGKTTLIKEMVTALYSEDPRGGVYEYPSPFSEQFANVVVVAFSPFDSFPNGLSKESDISDLDVPYKYIGLSKQGSDLFASIKETFIEAFKICAHNRHKNKLLQESIALLASDPGFIEAGIAEALCRENIDDDAVKMMFDSLSSGHKVVLLIVTCCVAYITEKSILFIDEPENHLHPPLLSSLIRALSELLIDRNGVAIISTHSPVVVQEVPSNCVWMLRRWSDSLVAERPSIETFGASVGTLTNEIFGLEVGKSGFNGLLRKVAKTSDSYQDALDKFDGKLGEEGAMILRSLMFQKESEAQ